MVKQLISGGWVHESAELARLAVEARSSKELSWFANDCEPIAELRRSIADLDPSGRFSRAILISAPHTHWGECAIVQSYDKSLGHYLVGPKSDVCSTSLRPVSFVFTEQGPIPYEWADASVPIVSEELQEVLDFIGLLCSEYLGRLSYSPPVVGVLVDHRFKLSLFDHRLFSFSEGSHDESNGRAVVRPVLQSLGATEFPIPDVIQSAWTASVEDAACTVQLPLNDSQACYLRDVREKIVSMRWESATIWFQNLVESLKASASDDAVQA